jgi:hypothetical protein
MPGSFFPSRNSRLAPPPVDTWLNLPFCPIRETAATLSPPPTTLKAMESEMARAISSVPRS